MVWLISLIWLGTALSIRLMFSKLVRNWMYT